MTQLQEATQYRSLYELTGDIKDLNTMMVPRTALAQQVEQQGWKRVPVEPTPEMLKAPPNAWEADAKITYAAMLAAAPAPQAQDVAELVDALEMIVSTHQGHCEHHVGVSKHSYNLADIAEEALFKYKGAK